MSQQDMQQALDALDSLHSIACEAQGVARLGEYDVIRAVLEKKFAAYTAGAAGPIGMPLAWIYEDELPDSYPYDEMFPHSEVRSGVRMFPVFGPPAIEANDAQDAAPDFDEWWSNNYPHAWMRAEDVAREAWNAAMSTHQPKESGNGH